MFESLEKNTEINIEIVEKLIDIHNNSLENFDDTERPKIKQYYHCSTLTRLYAVFENFIHVLISDYLDSLSENVEFENLSEKFKTEYRIGISHILSKLDQRRYKHLNHENLIEWYYNAIQNKENYKLIPEALTRHEENFRLNIIESLFGKIQLNEFTKWLVKNNHVLKHFEEKENIAELLDNELKEFVQLRNDASHGNLDALEGDNKLKNYCSLIKALVKCITEFFRNSLLSIKLEKDSIKELGYISEVFKQAEAHILVVRENSNLNLNGKILLTNTGNCYYEEITSLQINGENIDNVTSDSDDYEVGVKFKSICNIGTKAYLVN